jgi:hypothetical protein
VLRLQMRKERAQMAKNGCFSPERVYEHLN